jgi:hypothetical protein
VAREEADGAGVRKDDRPRSADDDGGESQTDAEIEPMDGVNSVAGAEYDGNGCVTDIGDASEARQGDGDDDDESGARRGAGEDSIAARSSEVQLCTGNAGQRMAEKSPDEREKCG